MMYLAPLTTIIVLLIAAGFLSMVALVIAALLHGLDDEGVAEDAPPAIPARPEPRPTRRAVEAANLEIFTGEYSYP